MIKLHRPNLTQNNLPFRLALTTTGAALTGLIFFWLWSQIAAGNVYSIDQAILVAFRKSGDMQTLVGPKLLLEIMIGFTKLGGATVVTLVIAASALFIYRKGAHRIALIIVAAAISGRLAVAILKEFFQRPRPDVVEHLVTVHSASFPSGHAANCAIAFLIIAFVFIHFKSSIKLRFLVFTTALLLIFAVGVSRIALGVHWPSDVLAGWIFGLCWACFWALLMKLPEARVAIETIK